MTSGLDPGLTFATLVQGAANQLATAAARAVAESPTPPFNPLYLHGPPGTGKTHLLHATGNQALAVDPRAVVRLVRWGDLLAGLRTAEAVGRPADFLAPYEVAGLLLIDDVDAPVGADPACAAVVALLEARLGRRLLTVLAGREPPLGFGGSDLPAARFLGAGLVAELLPPDSAMRWEILHQCSGEAGAVLSDAVLEAVALLPIRDVRDLRGAAQRLLAFQAVSAQALDPAQARVLITGVVDQPAPDAGVPAPREVRSAPPPRVPVGEEADEFGSFLSDVVASVSRQVDEWRARVAEAILRWEAEGYRTARLQALLDQELPAQPDAVLARFEEDVAALSRLREAVAEEAPDLADHPVLRDPDQVAEAESLLEDARHREVLGAEPLPHHRFDTLVEGTANRHAVEAARALVAAPEAGPLLLVGRSGAGKTHLLHAIGNALIAEGVRGLACFAAHAFAAEVHEARTAPDGLPGWRKRFRWVRALLLDDLHLLAEEPGAQEELAALLDRLAEGGRPVALASAAPLADLDGLAPGLLSRLSSGTTADLAPPDREMRRGVAAQLLAAVDAPEAEALADYLAGRPADSLRAVHAMVQRVLRAAEAGHALPGPALAHQVLEGPASRPRPALPRGPGPSLARGRLGEKLVERWPAPADLLVEEFR